MNQQTIGNRICARGTGRRGNRVITLVLSPLRENSGIVFRCQRDGKAADVVATADNAMVREGKLALQHRNARIFGVENLLAACFGLGVSNLLVELDGDELPVMNDSPAAYTFLLQSAGIVAQHAQRKVIDIQEPLLQRETQGWVRVTQYDGLRIGCVNTLNENAVSVQRSSTVVDISEAVFVSELCHAQGEVELPATDKAISRVAARNLRNKAHRSQLNYMVVEVLALLALTNAGVRGCYTAFDVDMNLHLNMIRSIVCAHDEMPQTGLKVVDNL